MPEERTEKTIGAILREARTVRNISLEDASRRTRIHPNILRSMESDDFQKLGIVYGKSFLKMYAEFLGCDKTGLLRRLENVFGPKTDDFAKTVNVLTPEPTPEVHGVFVRAVKQAQVVLRKVNMRFLGSVVGVIVIGLLVVVLGARAVRSIRSRPKPAPADQKPGQAEVSAAAKPSKPASAKPAEVKEPAAVPLVEAPKPAPAKPASPEPAAVKPAVLSSKEKLVLVIRAKDKCWIQVKVDGKVAFQNILVKGAAETWQAQEKIELWLGNAGVIQMELNGRLLEKIGRPGQTLRNVVITRSGLSVRR
jgi:cytoskeletal protein RodZ